MMSRRLLGALMLAAALALAGCGKKEAQAPAAPKELVFSILSAEDQASMGPLWQPLLDEMSVQVGVPVKPYFASNYTALIEAMRFNQVQVGWFSADPALEAITRANAQVLGRVVDAGGEATYRSVLIVRKGSGLTLDQVLKCDKRLSFGLGDAKSTSGTLAPLAYLFTPRGIEPAQCFKAVRNASHQANVYAVANGVLDVSTNNSVGLVFARRPPKRIGDKVEVIWNSPPLPESAILVRQDLDPALKEKIRRFFLTYGTGEGPKADRQRQVLAGLAYGGFKPADDGYLDPIREMHAVLALAEAHKAGDAAKVAAAQAALDKIRARIAHQQAVAPEG